MMIDFHLVHNIWIAALLIMILNLPFGYWRAGVTPFSRSWFLAVHLPVPLVIAVRLGLGFGFHLFSISIFVLAFFCGQFIGGKLRLLF